MNKKIITVFFIVSSFIGSCISIPPNLASQSAIQSTNTPDVPTLLPTFVPPTETVTPRVPTLIAIEPTYPVVLPAPLDYEIPLFPGAQDVAYNFLAEMDQPGNTVYYAVSEPPSEKIRAFYMDELIQDGWEWVYTDSDESLSVPFPFPAWVMEFKKGEHKLGIGTLGYGGESSVVLAGVDFSGGNLISNFIGAIAGGLDLMGPFESNAGPDAMQFSSALLEFTHPVEWQATDRSMQIFYTDSAVNYMPNADYCSVDMDPCFINFSASPGFHFDIPISIRVYPGMADRTLEEVNILRWEELNSIASAPFECCFFPEHYALAGSLESIEVRNIVLADGSPALQRVYRWKQEDVEEFIIGTYTLFTSAGVLVEFHTDFTSTDWEEMHSTVEQVIASIKINQ
ncbi:MAG TPA: hypothetical protein VJ022_11185 [Anaerolineales bacterium]|nr:hypothetical protein [Anaerolineales bacterium]